MVDIPEGLILEKMSIHAPVNSEGKFKDMKFTKLASAVFSNVVTNGQNVKFIKVNDNGIEYWSIVTIKNIKKGKTLSYNPNDSDISFGDDLL